MADFVNKIAEKRQLAHDNGQKDLSCVYKLINNSCYGRLGKSLF